MEARLMRARIEDELSLLRVVYGVVEHAEAGGEDWFRIRSYGIPKGWLLSGSPVSEIAVAFLIKADYPGGAPYGFLTPVGLTSRGAPPQNTGALSKLVPFPGDWLHFSWQPESGWQPSDDPAKGSNLVSWARGFAARLREGA
jgi:hypothetical protein